MAVVLTVSETITGSAVSDSLAGGGTGVDLGSVTNGAYAPITLQSANTGHQDIFIRHNATIDPITNVKLHIEAFSQTYGGAKTASQDYIDIKALGAASGSSKNNNDGLSGGFWVDMDWDASTANQFDQGSFPTVVKIFGDNSTDGISLASAFTINSASMVYNLPPETAATTPVSGQIGKSGDTVLGDRSHLKFRIYVTTAWPDGGYVQWDLVISYSFTA